jgi:ubiquinone/menaquinone biosynthesis C-methylase UbiE
MPAAYDSYDYPSYWEKRRYEHEAEVFALKKLLSRIPKIKTILEVGVGYGRLTSIYKYRANKIILTDPSSRLLKLARKSYSGKNVKFIHSKMENLPGTLRANTADLIIMVRVLHHIKDIDEAFIIIKKLLKDNGFFILEFANKKHFKAMVKEFLHGNLTFPLDISPQDKRSPDSKKENTIPFVNYHPDTIIEKLRHHGFKIIETRSVSNVRSTWMKKHLPLEFLMALEKKAQLLLNKFSFGPSIFILAKNNHR